MNRQNNTRMGPRVSAGLVVLALSVWAMAPTGFAQTAAGHQDRRGGAGQASAPAKATTGSGHKAARDPVIANKAAELDGPGDEPAARHARWVAHAAKSAPAKKP